MLRVNNISGMSGSGLLKGGSGGAISLTYVGRLAVSSASPSGALDLGAVDNRYIIAIACCQAAPTAIVAAGVSLALKPSIGGLRLGWKAVPSGAGSQTCSATFGGSTNGAIYFFRAIAAGGLAFGSQLGINSSGLSKSGKLVLPDAPVDHILVGAAKNNAPATFTWSGMTEQADELQTIRCSAAMNTDPSDGNNTVGVTIASSGDIAMLAAFFKSP